MPRWLSGGLRTAAALFAGWVGFVLAYVLHLKAWISWYDDIGPFALVTGFPTFGGAPAGIHIINVAIWAIPAALFYGFAMRLLHGRPLVWRRLVGLYVVGVCSAAVTIHAIFAAIVAGPAAIRVLELVYALVGLTIVRTFPLAMPATVRTDSVA